MNGGGVEQVELGVGAGEEVGVAEAGELAVDGGADEAAMSGDVDAGFERHVAGHRLLLVWRGVPPLLPVCNPLRMNHLDRHRTSKYVILRDLELNISF